MQIMEPTPLEIVLEEIRDLDAKRSTHERDIEELKTEIAACDHQLIALRRLRQRIEKATPPDKRNGLLPPTEAIRDLLRHHPHGLKTREIADELENRIETASDNKRRLIHSLTDQLRKRGEIARDEDGVNTLVE